MRSETSKKEHGTFLNWNTIIWMIIFHAGAVAALFMFTWPALIVTVFLWWMSGNPGIGMGFHRLLTHRGYKTPKWVENLLTLSGLLALEGGQIQWVVTHRIHHMHTEVPGKDPHTPRDGGWWAHMGWILQGTAQRHSDEVLWRYAPDLMKDRFHFWVNRLYYIPLVISGVILFAVGGWSMLLWAVFLRITIGLHITWLVNSATHMWGKRRFETTDDSTNLWWVALLTFGEGWHNNHHAHPTAARHGLKWYEIDMNWYGIRLLKMFGLAKSIKLINKTAYLPSAKSDTLDNALSKAA